MKVHDSALKHGVLAEDAIQAAGRELLIHAMKARPQMLDLLP